MSEQAWGVVPAAGVGTRMASTTPKQYLPLAGKTVLQHSVAALLDSGVVSRIALALHPEDRHPVSRTLLEDPRLLAVAGGAQRCDSVLAALEALSELAQPLDWVLVHDAARPCVKRTDIEGLFEVVNAAGIGGILAEPVLDTVKQADQAGLVECTLDRSRLWRAQTPQMFRYGELYRSLTEATRAGAVITDEASAMEWAGLPVRLVQGSADNIKITRPADLELAAWYLQRRTALVRE